MLDIARFRAWFHKVFFWLPPRTKQSTEQGPDSERDHALILSVTKPSAVPSWRQLRYVGRFLSLMEQRLLVILFLLGIVFAAGGGAFLAMNHLTALPVVGGTYTEALIGEPHAINPVDAPANQVDSDLCSLIYSGLFRAEGFEMIPDLAESYSWSEDLKTLTVQMRQDAVFHHGQPVTANDVQFTYEAIQDPLRESILALKFRGVQAIASDRFTVQFVLDQPDVNFIKSLTVGILPADLWQSIPSQNARLANINLKPIGSGPYQIKAFTRDNRGIIRSYTLIRSEMYYGTMPYIKTLTFQFFPDQVPAEDALKSDLVDGLAFLMPSDTKRFASASRWHSVALEVPQQAIAFFNLKDKTLEDIRVRQALIQAIDRQDLIEALDGRASIADTPYPFIQATTSTPTDIEAARGLLDKAGWKLPENEKIRVFKDKAKDETAESASSTPFSLTITVPEQPDLVAMAEVLQRQWSLLGAQVTIETMDAATALRKSTRDRDTQIVLWNLLLPPEQDLFPIWWSSQAGEGGMNFSSLAEKDVDQYINETKSATSSEALTLAQTQLSEAIMKQSPAAFLIRPNYGYVISSRIKGVPETLRLTKPSNRFQYITSWYIKTGWTWK